MANTYTWRPTDGLYFSSSGGSSGISNHVYYSSNRTFRMDFPDLGGLLGKAKSSLSIQSAVLTVYIMDAHSATLTIGYSYKTAFADRKTMLASKSGISMKTSSGWMDIDLTDVIKAYIKDGTSNAMRLWGYGTGGSSSNSRFRGINPSSSYTAQRPYPSKYALLENSVGAEVLDNEPVVQTVGRMYIRFTVKSFTWNKRIAQREIAKALGKAMGMKPTYHRDTEHNCYDYGRYEVGGWDIVGYCVTSAWFDLDDVQGKAAHSKQNVR